MTLETKISGLNKPVSRILLGTTGRDFSAGAPPWNFSMPRLNSAFAHWIPREDTPALKNPWESGYIPGATETNW